METRDASCSSLRRIVQGRIVWRAFAVEGLVRGPPGKRAEACRAAGGIGAVKGFGRLRTANKASRSPGASSWSLVPVPGVREDGKAHCVEGPARDPVPGSGGAVAEEKDELETAGRRRIPRLCQRPENTHRVSKVRAVILPGAEATAHITRIPCQSARGATCSIGIFHHLQDSNSSNPCG